MTAEQSPRNHRSARPGGWRTGRRLLAPAVATAAAALLLSACGGGSSAGTAAGSSSVGSSGSCAGVKGANHARVVVETSSSSVVQRCVGFSSPEISALKLLSAAHVPLGTQKYSFGLAICQVDNVPAHYSQCLPSGKPYWALFVSHDGAPWVSAAAGVSDTKVKPGDSLGLRYDSPKGNPAPPPAPTRA